MTERRTVLAALAGASIGLCVGEGGLAVPRSRASPAEATLQEAAGQGAARRTWVSPGNCYFAYPHNNGFLPGSGLPVIAQRGGQFVTFSEWDFRRGTLRPILRTGIGSTYYDIAEATGDLFFIQDRARIHSVSTRPRAEAERDLALHFDSPERIEDLISVNRAGDRVLYALERRAADQRTVLSARFLELEVTGGGSAAVCDMPFNADHQQYCPHDESWVGFAHEGDISLTLDRVWGIHRTGGGAQPHKLWDERAQTGVLLAGHERWAFHRTGALVVAYPSSEGRPRGLYFVDAATRHAELVSASDYDWHCNISRSGRWAVVDTTQAHGATHEPDGRIVSDVILVDMRTGARTWLARSHADRHPWHPHPHISPDERTVIYNDYQHDGAGRQSCVVVVEMDQA